MSYNKTNDSITLVKGHYWKLDSKGATPSVSERWLNENKEWTGSNFFDVPSMRKCILEIIHSIIRITKSNMLLTHEAKIMIDYEAYNIPGKSLPAMPRLQHTR